MGATIENRARVFTKVIEPPAKLLFKLSCYVVAAMSIPICIDVALRFATGKTILGIIEIEEFMLVCIVFGAMPLLQLSREHIDIEIFTSRLPLTHRAIIGSFVYLTLSILFGLATWQAVLNFIRKLNEVSLALGIPVSIFVGLSVVATALTTIAFAIDSVKAAASLPPSRRGAMVGISLAAAAVVLFSPLILKALWPEAGGLAIGALGMLLLFVLLFLRMPIGFAMALIGFLGMWALTGRTMAALRLLGISPYAETASFIMAVLPLFVLMGELAFFSGMSRDLFASAYKWFGRMPGGLAMSSVAGSAGFAAVCGDSLATAVTMGSIALPEMKKRGYSPSLATGGIAAGGTLGILIPPSLGFIFYAIVTEESVGKLFVAGFVPGLLLTALFILYIYIAARRHPHKAPPGESFSIKEKIVSLKGVVAMVGLFTLILGGILGGVFSPTEGGAIGAACCFCYALARGRINKAVLTRALEETAKITCKIMVVVIGVGILGSFLAASRLPYHLANLVTDLQLNRYLILVAVVLLYLFLGCLMNVIPIMLLTLPAIFPSILALGFDPVWFGVISVILMEMGQITPPIGIIVFAVGSMEKDLPLETIFRGVIPFVGCMLLSVVILTVFPQIALWLPGLFFN